MNFIILSNYNCCSLWMLFNSLSPTWNPCDLFMERTRPDADF